MAARRTASAPQSKDAKDAKADSQRLSRTNQAFREIRMRITDLRFPPGSAFTEGELAAELGLSKTPVREALLMLANNGLVFARPGAGYRVAPITLKDAKCLCAHRALLEAEAAAKVAMRGLDGHTTMHMTELVDNRTRRSDASAFSQNTSFHMYIAAATEDKYLHRDLTLVLWDLERLLRLALPHLDRDHSHDQGHRELLEAILGNDPEGARAAALAHAERTEKLVIDALLSSDALQGINLGRAPESAPAG